MSHQADIAENTVAPDPAKVAEFSRLSQRLQQGGVIEPNAIRSWCHLGLELRQPGMVQGVCQNLLAQNNIHPALRPYWLYFLGAALLHQFRVDDGVVVLHQGLEALCVAPRVYNSRPQSRKYEDPRVTDLLWQALAQLAAGGVQAFAHAGTLLGLVREKRLLPFDKDLDLGLMTDELPLAHDVLSANGWLRPTPIFPIENMATYHHQDVGVVLDLCGFEKEPGSDDLLAGFRINKGKPLAWQRITRFAGPLQLDLAHGPAGDVWQLRDPEPWLASMYGEQWRTPDPDFDTAIGAYNLVGFSTLTRWYTYARIINPWLEGYWEKALRLTRLALERHVPDDPLLLKVAQTLEGNLAILGHPQ